LQKLKPHFMLLMLFYSPCGPIQICDHQRITATHSILRGQS